MGGVKRSAWYGLKQLEMYEVVGILFSLLAVTLFFAYGDDLDAKQGVEGWHWHPVMWIWDIYRAFIPKAFLVALATLLAIGKWKMGSWRWGLAMTGTVVRFALPFIVLLIIYRAVNFYIPLFSPVDRDDWLMAADEWMFGVQPTMWMQQFITPWLSDFFSFAYMIWFPMIFFTVLLMLLKSRDAVTSYLTSALFAFYIGYVCYTIVPAVGPLYALADQFTVSLSGGAITSMQVGVVVQPLATPRDVFPSLHTAMSCVMLYYIAVYRRRWLWLYAPLVASILISTVYLRYHYVIDVIAGIGLASFTCYFGRRWNLRWRAWRMRDGAAVQAKVTEESQQAGV